MEDNKVNSTQNHNPDPEALARAATDAVFEELARMLEVNPRSDVFSPRANLFQIAVDAATAHDDDDKEDGGGDDGSPEGDGGDLEALNDELRQALWDFLEADLRDGDADGSRGRVVDALARRLARLAAIAAFGGMSCVTEDDLDFLDIRVVYEFDVAAFANGGAA